MRIRDDGSVQSSAIPTHQNAGRPEDNSLYRCMVTKVTFVDDPSNITANSSSPRVLYECVVLGGFASGQVISNCRLSSDLGGNFNFYERTLRAASKNVSKTRLADQDGDVVFVQFVQGHTAYPVIVALDQGIKPVGVGAKASDGQIAHWQYNGIDALVDKSGNLTLTRKGGSYDDSTKVFTPTQSGKKVQVQVSGQKIVMTMGNGLVVTIDGDTDKVNIQTKGGAKATIDGSGTIHLKDAGTGALKISGSKVALGASSAELLAQISEQLDKLITFFGTEGSHTHMGNLGFPTGPPSNAGASSTAASDLGTIKGKIDGIKGSL